MTTGVEMSDPATWPLGRVLPLVRRSPGLFPDCGLLVRGGGPVVFEIELLQATRERLAECPRQVYATFAEVREAGWEID